MKCKIIKVLPNMSEQLLSGKRQKLASFLSPLQRKMAKIQAGWDNLKEKTIIWCGLDAFRHGFDTVNWKNGPQRFYMHSICKIKLFNGRSMVQAKTKKGKEKYRRRDV